MTDDKSVCGKCGEPVGSEPDSCRFDVIWCCNAPLRCANQARQDQVARVLRALAAGVDDSDSVTAAILDKAIKDLAAEQQEGGPTFGAGTPPGAGRSNPVVIEPVEPGG